MLGQRKVDTVGTMLKSKDCKVEAYYIIFIIARSRTTLKQADNAVSAKAQARFSSFTTLSFFGEVLTMIADWSDIRDFILVRTLRASWVGRLQVSCWNIWTAICTIFTDCPKNCSSFRQKKELTFTFNLYWFHSFMNLSVNHDHLYVYCYSPCSHYPQPVDKKIKLRCLHPSSTRLGGLKGDPSFLHSSACYSQITSYFIMVAEICMYIYVPTSLLHGTWVKVKLQVKQNRRWPSNNFIAI